MLSNLIISLFVVSTTFLLIDLYIDKYKNLFKGNLKNYTVISVLLSIIFIVISLYCINHFYGDVLNRNFDIKNTSINDLFLMFSGGIYVLFVFLPSISLIKLIHNLVNSKKEISKMMYEYLNDICHEETKKTIDAFGVITIEQAFVIEYKASLHIKKAKEEAKKSNSEEQQIKKIKQKIREQK